jgi:hypothetical protein
MKTLCACLAALLLSSCILVDDLNGYWKKGVIDPALVGSWMPDEHFAKSPAQAVAMAMMLHGDKYQLDVLDVKGRVEEGNKPVFVKTLNVPPYKFLMSSEDGIRKGGLIRYAVDGETVKLYFPVIISMQGGKPHKQRFMAITKLNASILKQLANTPDDNAHWEVAAQYKKIH